MNININNYEEWMIDYIEGNLSAGQQKELTEFLAFHPELKAELDLFGQTKLQPEMQVVFAGKEGLKQKENGKVIVMANWVRYATAAAAVLLVFVGIRNFSGNKGSEQFAIKPYSRQTLENPYAYDRKTNDLLQPKQTDDRLYIIENEFAEVKEEEITPQQDQKSPDIIKQQLQRETIDAVTGIEFAEMNEIKLNNNPQLKDVMTETGDVSTDELALNQQSDKSKNISLNDNTSIVDWMNDAIAMGGEVGGLVESFILKDEKQTAVESDSPYKTTNVNLFGITYYSRKKTN